MTQDFQLEMYRRLKRRFEIWSTPYFKMTTLRRNSNFKDNRELDLVNYSDQLVASGILIKSKGGFKVIWVLDVKP